MRIVVVAKYVPWPPNSGDKRRTLGLLRALQELGDVTVCAFSGADERSAELEAEGITVVTTGLNRSPRTLLEGLLRCRSITAARFWSPTMAKLVGAQLAGADVLVIEHVQLAAYAGRARPRVRVLDMHNIESSLTTRMAQGHGFLKRFVLRGEAAALRRLERTATDFDHIAVVSTGDEAMLRDIASHPSVIVVPNAWDSSTPLPPATAPVVSFVALMSWSPNAEACQWFVRSVWPLVQAGMPESRLLLVGRRPTPAVVALASASIEVTGTVDDLEPYYQRTRVAVAPLLAGGGSRLKILEALAFGRPVVATSIGVEGLEDLVGRGVEVSDKPQEMAAQILALLRSPEEATQLGLRGAAAVDDDHSWRAAARPLLEAIQSTLGAAK